MKEFSFIAETPSAKIKIYFKYTMTLSNRLCTYENRCKTEEKCQQGCANYNNKWSCPPHSPEYSAISKKFNKAYIFLFYCYLEQFNYIEAPYIKIKAANSIVKSRSDKIIRQLEKESEGKLLSSGSCRLCKCCSCKTKESQCKKPAKLRFSMESVGLNIENIAAEFFNHKLSRYIKNNVPQYSSLLTTILTNKVIDEEQINKLILDINNL